MKVFANNARDGKKGWVVGDNEGNKLWFVQCGSVVGCMCFSTCDIVLLVVFHVEGNSSCNIF